MSEEGWASRGQTPRTGGCRCDATGEGELTLLLCSLCPVLPAIYLAKKNIRKRGGLVDHEKVGHPCHPSQAESSQRNPVPTCGPRARSPGPRVMWIHKHKHPRWSQRGGGGVHTPELGTGESFPLETSTLRRSTMTSCTGRSATRGTW